MQGYRICGDVIDAFLTALNNPAVFGRIYNVAGGEKITVEDLIDALKKAFGYNEYPVEYMDSTSGDQFGIVAAISRIRKEMGWTPSVDLHVGIEKMVSFEKRRREIEYK